MKESSRTSKKFSYGYSNKVYEPPCKGCADRNAECHAHCEKYLDFERKRFQLHAEMATKFRQEDQYTAYAFSRRLRMYKIMKGMGRSSFKV